VFVPAARGATYAENTELFRSRAHARARAKLPSLVIPQPSISRYIADRRITVSRAFLFSLSFSPLFSLSLSLSLSVLLFTLSNAEGTARREPNEHRRSRSRSRRGSPTRR